MNGEKNSLEAAAHLAALGQYSAALTILDRLGGETPPLEALLLRARIHAQQGRFDDAIVCWRQALEHDPGNKEAAKGIGTAERYRKRRAPAELSYSLSLAARVVAVVLLCVVFFALGILTGGRGEEDALRMRRMEEQLSGLQQKLETVHSRLAPAVEQLDEQTSDIKALQDGLATLQQAYSQSYEVLLPRVEGLTAELEGALETRLARQKDELVRALGEDLQEKLADALAGLTTEVGELNKRADGIAAGLEQLETDYRETAGALDGALRRRLAAFQERIVELLRLRSLVQELIAAGGSDWRGTDEELQALRENLRQLQELIETLRAAPGS